jgi:hypothetical protein
MRTAQAGPTVGSVTRTAKDSTRWTDDNVDATKRKTPSWHPKANENSGNA